jgi:hypothetical protein
MYGNGVEEASRPNVFFEVALSLIVKMEHFTMRPWKAHGKSTVNAKYIS